MKHEEVGTCRICGAPYSCNFYSTKSNIRKFMYEEGVCGTCAAWMSRDIDPNAKEEVIDGKVYKIYPFVDNPIPGDFLGGMGKVRYIMDLKTMFSYKSNDVWLVGEPPPAFQTPDTAIFVDRYIYKSFTDGPFECQGITCLDRYTCAMYFKEKTEKDGPFNTVPEDWVDGDERCKTYINIKKANKLIMEWRKSKQ